MIVRIGDTVASEFGEGKVIAITKEWLIYGRELQNGRIDEVCLYLPDQGVWVPAEFGVVDVDKNATIDIPKEGKDD